MVYTIDGSTAPEMNNTHSGVHTIDTFEENEEEEVVKHQGEKKRKKKYREIDGGIAWLVLISCFFGYFITDGLLATFSVFYVAFLERYEESKSFTTWIGSAQGTLIILLGSIVGGLIERFGCRCVIVIGSILSTTGFILSAFAKSASALIGFYGIITGVGLSFIIVTCATAPSLYFDKKRSLANGLACAGNSAGLIVLTPAAQYSIDNYTLYNTLWYVAALTLQGVVLGTMIIPLRKNKVATSDTNLNNLPATEETQHKSDRTCSLKHVIKYVLHKSGISLLKNKKMAVLCIALLMRTIGFFAAQTFLVDVAVHEGISPQQASFLMSIIGICDFINAILWGYIGDKISAKARWILFAVTCIICGADNLLMPLCHTYWNFIIYSCVFGITRGIYLMNIPVVTGDVVGRDNIERGVGIALTISGCAGFFLPLLGWLTDRTGSYDLTYIIIGTIEVGAGVLLLAVLLKSICGRSKSYTPEHPSEQHHENKY